MPGGPRTPTAILELRGGLKDKRLARRHNVPHRSDKKDPRALPNVDALREAQARPELRDPPATMKPDAVLCWNEIVDRACFGTLKESDWIVVEELASLLARCRRQDWDVPAPVLGALNRCLQVLGLTPADRSRIAIAKPKQDPDSFGAFKATRAA